MHGDHIGGMLQNKQVAFPNARVYINQREYDYWSKSNNQLALNVLNAYKDNIKCFDLGKAKTHQNILPGIRAIAAYGHTPGHTMYLLGEDEEQLLVWGDLTHAMAIQMPYPKVAVTYDSDPKQAIESRITTLELVSENHVPVAGMHIAYPAIGTIADNGKGGYEFVPDKR
jgi:glyoxylase-like metal-dependent hydrolase (beta-lactamase superfamily II)